MVIKQLLDEDLVNYKKTSMVIAFPYCSFKCEKECGKKVCQNGALATAPNIEIDVETIINRYINNPITKAVVCGGLEPFDTWEELQKLIIELRQKTQDDIVIYTGYKKEEISYAVDWLNLFPNIIIKFGRYIPDQQSHYDEVLGINLASSNQYAEKIS
jgi:hypothetical protein